MKLYDVSVCLGKSDSRWMEVFRFKGVAWKGVVEGGGGWGGGCMESVLTVSQVLYHVNSGGVLHAAL